MKAKFIKHITFSFFCLLATIFLISVYMLFPGGNQSSLLKREIASEKQMNCMEMTKVIFNSVKIKPLGVSKKTEAELAEYFRRINDEQSVDLTKLYDFMTLELKDSKGRGFTIGDNLLADLKKGPMETQGFLKIGYRIVTTSEKTFLESPRSLVEIYLNIYKQLIPYVGKSITEEDLILPALIFKRGNEVKLFRPLLDPFPSKSEGWILVKNAKDATLNNKEFAIAISEGKMPLEATMYFHDLGHIAYDIERPEIMGLRRKYFKREVRILNGQHISAHKETGYYLNEFLITLRLKNRDKIKRLLTPKMIQSDDVRIEELMADLDKGVLQKRIEEIQTNFHSLFEGHGGGWMDGRSMLVFPKKISEEVDARVHRWPTREENIGYHLSRSSYWGLVEQLKYALKEVSFHQKNPGIFNVGGTLVDREETYKKVLVEIMLDLEKRSAAGLKYNVDTQQVWRDASVENFSNTRTYKFFSDSNRTKNGDLDESSLEVQFMRSSFGSKSK